VPGVSPASRSNRPVAVPESPTSSRLVVVAPCAAPRSAARRRRAGRDRPPGSAADRRGADRSRGARCSARRRSGDIVALPRTGIRAARRYRSAGRRTGTQVSAPGHRSHHPTRCPAPIPAPGAPWHRAAPVRRTAQHPDGARRRRGANAGGVRRLRRRPLQYDGWVMRSRVGPGRMVALPAPRGRVRGHSGRWPHRVRPRVRSGPGPPPSIPALSRPWASSRAQPAPRPPGTRSPRACPPAPSRRRRGRSGRARRG